MTIDERIVVAARRYEEAKVWAADLIVVEEDTQLELLARHASAADVGDVRIRRRDLFEEMKACDLEVTAAFMLLGELRRVAATGIDAPPALSEGAL